MAPLQKEKKKNKKRKEKKKRVGANNNLYFFNERVYMQIREPLSHIWKLSTIGDCS